MKCEDEGSISSLWCVKVVEKRDDGGDKRNWEDEMQRKVWTSHLSVKTRNAPQHNGRVERKIQRTQTAKKNKAKEFKTILRRKKNRSKYRCEILCNPEKSKWWTGHPHLTIFGEMMRDSPHYKIPSDNFWLNKTMEVILEDDKECLKALRSCIMMNNDWRYWGHMWVDWDQSKPILLHQEGNRVHCQK